MSESEDVEIIYPDNLLGAKVTLDGPDPAAMFEQAAADIGRLNGEYTTWSQSYLAAIAEGLAAISRGGKDHKPYLEAIYEAAHDMKGHGGTFGYDMITDIADSLGGFVEPLDHADKRQIAIMENHLDALGTVIQNEIQGDGGDVGKALVAGLRQLTAK